MSLTIRSFDDVLWARQEVQRFAAALPFDAADLNRIDIAVSELATNLVKHGLGGTIALSRLERGDRQGLRVTATDQGPGIVNVEAALRPGYSTTGSLGDGLAALREVMDKFELQSSPGRGTRVEVEKWLPQTRA